MADGLDQQKEDTAKLDTKVDATIGAVVTIGDKVIEHDKEIGELETGLCKVEERVDDVEGNQEETKIKIEEIDKKVGIVMTTMTTSCNVGRHENVLSP